MNGLLCDYCDHPLDVCPCRLRLANREVWRLRWMPRASHATRHPEDRRPPLRAITTTAAERDADTRQADAKTGRAA